MIELLSASATSTGAAVFLADSMNFIPSKQQKPPVWVGTLLGNSRKYHLYGWENPYPKRYPKAGGMGVVSRNNRQCYGNNGAYALNSGKRFRHVISE